MSNKPLAFIDDGRNHHLIIHYFQNPQLPRPTDPVALAAWKVARHGGHYSFGVDKFTNVLASVEEAPPHE